ncbi:uncharacterized protein B0H18DRAFT_52654 [Fomitopsis serialis]|uniref:uncharacterized protein n=1 Tax=Fomitopsis serialis TaxID=139415 RepID=UPI002007EFA3|nr:uncharacterized protein B0H18DRAFT_52654 [Neoantrodia serialis]KAH9932287.1 hypothetical protein B0H18DRAFT_52654 [Neoantrodia serialis]
MARCMARRARTQHYAYDDCQPTDAIAAVNLARLTAPSRPAQRPLRMLGSSDAVASAGRTARQRCHGNRILSQADTVRCLDARKALVHDHVVAALRIFDPSVSMPCEQPAECSSILDSRSEWLRTQDHWETGLFDCLTSRTVQEFVRHEPLCQACEQMLEVRHRRERLKIWSQLPEYFGVDVPGWVTTA